MAEHTDTDRVKKDEAEKILHDWWMQRMNPKMGWTEMLKEGGSRLDHGMSGYHTYDHDSRCAEGMAHVFINATPKQVTGLYADPRNSVATSQDVLAQSYTTETGLLQVPIPIPTVSDRELMYRSVWFRNDQDNSFINVAYTIEDERRPVGEGKVRQSKRKYIKKNEL